MASTRLFGGKAWMPDGQQAPPSQEKRQQSGQRILRAAAGPPYDGRLDHAQ